MYKLYFHPDLLWAEAISFLLCNRSPQSTYPCSLTVQERKVKWLRLAFCICNNFKEKCVVVCFLFYSFNINLFIYRMNSSSWGTGRSRGRRNMPPSWWDSSRNKNIRFFLHFNVDSDEFHQLSTIGNLNLWSPNVSCIPPVYQKRLISFPPTSS